MGKQLGKKEKNTVCFRAAGSCGVQGAAGASRIKTTLQRVTDGEKPTVSDTEKEEGEEVKEVKEELEEGCCLCWANASRAQRRRRKKNCLEPNSCLVQVFQCHHRNNCTFHLLVVVVVVAIIIVMIIGTERTQRL